MFDIAKHFDANNIPIKLSIGSGQRVIPQCISIDKNPALEHLGVVIMNVDNAEDREGLPKNHFEWIECTGCLNEFKTDVVMIMNWFWDLLKIGGLLRIAVAVVDNGNGAFRDPLASRYLHSQWVEYFVNGGSWQNSGGKLGLGFYGEFDLVSNVIDGERQTVEMRAVKR